MDDARAPDWFAHSVIATLKGDYMLKPTHLTSGLLSPHSGLRAGLETGE
jgi:hypothetical protein